MCKRGVLLLVVILQFFVYSCQKEKVYYVEKGSVFHTYYAIKYQSDKILTDSIDAELQKFSLSLNPFHPNSIITKVNENKPVELDDWFVKVFNKAHEVSEKSGGAFDITCAPLINLWGFGFSNMDSVSQHMIDSLKTFVGYTKIRIENGKIVKDDPRLILNTSAIAKGFSCDIIADMLERQGVENYMVDIGGEIVVKGVNQNGNCWSVGIDRPDDDATGAAINVEEIVRLCKKGGVATSGNYRNYYIKDGKKYAHTIDPNTGYPAERSILSATVVADDCMTADAYATALMVLSVEHAAELAKKVPEIDYFLIYADEDGKHRFSYSEGMLKYLPNRKELAILENP
ncbi:FAD:protein FMN transferase [Massilibacteroides sp.]|uniref:FAD:protein FMN transferase n=1 Tax=Massilibacteroides sp. TaxID=2034766 RepID=UPI0026035F0E|nr:FAD:protein FMN transferase [Massilibacteroides sp.]MDD4515060.1 FAD:protein FMN transferase [Massilibacteroides sp.]